MIGFGLSLQGACVVADEYGATHLPDYRAGHVRGYFPAAGCTYSSMDGTSLVLNAHDIKTVTAKDWNMSAIACSFACCVTARGPRCAYTTFGTLSYYNGEGGVSNYAEYSTCHLRLASRLWTMEGGNCTVLHYSVSGTPYKQTSQHDNFNILINSSNVGHFHMTIKDMVLTAHVFDEPMEMVLPSFRYSTQYTRQQTLVLFGAGNLEMQFFHSCWRNDATKQAWLCLPMQSANRMSALFESTTKQMIEDETLSVA